MLNKPYLRIVVNHSRNCNMSCAWCHEEGMQRSSATSILIPSQISDICSRFHSIGISKFKIVGGEPTLRPDLTQIIEGLRSIGDDIDISMVSNGTRLQRLAPDYVDAGLNRVNVSLFSLRSAFFRENVGQPSLMARVDAGIRETIHLGILGKINHVYINDTELRPVLDYASGLGVRINVLNRIPSLSSDMWTPAREMLNHLRKALQVTSTRIEYDPSSLPVTVMSLARGGEVEIKHLELGNELRFRSCQSCRVREKCKEGIFAIRLTPTGRLQPCIVRDDNTMDALHATSSEIRTFLEAL